MDRPLGRILERADSRWNIWSRVVFDLRASVESHHLAALPLAALAEVPNPVDPCAEHLAGDFNDRRTNRGSTMPDEAFREAGQNDLTDQRARSTLSVYGRRNCRLR